MAQSGVFTKEGVCKVREGDHNEEDSYLIFGDAGEQEWMTLEALVNDPERRQYSEQRYRVRIRVEWERVD